MNQTSKAAKAALTAALLALSAPVFAEFYVGGGIGDGTIETSENTPDGSFDFDESDFAWKLFGGYMFSQYLGVEAAYIDMGSPAQNFSFVDGEDTVNVDFEAELTGFTVQGVAAYPFDVFEVFAKLGIVSYDAEFDARRSDIDGRLRLEDDGEELAYGIGAKYNIDNFALRVDWDIYDTGDIDERFDVDVWSRTELLSAERRR